MKAIKKGCFAQVGDLVREGWCYEKRCIAPPYTYGIVVEAQARSPEAYTAEQIAEKPIRMINMLTTDGSKIRRFSHHVEVISEVLR